jgi:hypothetical protein
VRERTGKDGETKTVYRFDPTAKAGGGGGKGGEGKGGGKGRRLGRKAAAKPADEAS